MISASLFKIISLKTQASIVVTCLHYSIFDDFNCIHLFAIIEKTFVRIDAAVLIVLFIFSCVAAQFYLVL